MAKPQLKKVEHVPHDEPHHGGGGGGHDDHGGGGHCPPPWIITFADMATLLMAFFVIMLMKAKTDQPKFNAFAAVMRETFGTVPLDERDDRGGVSIINLSPGPQSGEQTDEPPGTTSQSGDPDQKGPRQTQGKAGGRDSDAEALGQAIRDALAAQGELTVASDEGAGVVKLPKGSDQTDAQAFAATLEQAIGATGAQPGAADTGQAPASQGGAQAMRAGVRAEIAEIQTGKLLQTETYTGEVKVQRQDGKVVVTLGAGSADLTEQARRIIAQLERTAEKATRIVVTGHTDDVPVSGGAFRDNWDLAAARPKRRA